MQPNKYRNEQIDTRIKKAKSNKCLICLNDLFQKFNLNYLFSTNKKICPQCLEKFERANIIQNIHNKYQIWILYYYNDFLKSLIYQYKGKYDIELATVFLNEYYYKIKIKYHDYLILYPPSSKLDDEKRGFIHIQEIIKNLKIPYIDGFYKVDNYKQSEQSFNERKNIKEHIFIKKNLPIKNKKILIIDDIITSGNTIITIINLILKNYSPIRDIKVLIIAKSRQ